MGLGCQRAGCWAQPTTELGTGGQHRSTPRHAWPRKEPQLNLTCHGMGDDGDEQALVPHLDAHVRVLHADDHPLHLPGKHRPRSALRLVAGGPGTARQPGAGRQPGGSLAPRRTWDTLQPAEVRGALPPGVTRSPGSPVFGERALRGLRHSRGRGPGTELRCPPVKCPRVGRCPVPPELPAARPGQLPAVPRDRCRCPVPSEPRRPFPALPVPGGAGSPC